MRTLCVLALLGAVACTPDAAEEFDPTTVAGRTFVVDYDADDVDLSTSVIALRATMEIGGMLIQPMVEGDDIVLSIGFADPVEGLPQMSCLAPVEWDGLSLEPPILVSDDGHNLPFSFETAGEPFQFTALDATFTGEFAEDGSEIRDLEIQAYWDATEADAFVDGDTCSLLPALGLECGACPDGGDTCVKVSVRASSAPADPDQVYDPDYTPSSDPYCE